MQPNAPFFTPRSAENWRTQQAALASPAAPIQRPADSRPYRWAIWALRVVFVLLLALVLGTLFFLFGEAPPKWVRPELTTAERARAFRLPHL